MLLAGGDGDRGEAKVSPDATRVASTLLHRDDLNCTSLHVTDLSTGVDVAVVNKPGRNVRSPAWSPDGRLLAYADESPGWYEVFVIAADGSEPGRQLTSRRRRLRRVALVVRRYPRTRGVRTHHGVGDLVVIDAASGAVDVLAAGGSWSSPVWLADGSVVAVHESHTTPPRLCRVTGGEIDGAVRPDPSRRSGGAARRPRTCRLSLARRYRGLRLAVPSARRVIGRHPVPAIVYPHGGPTVVRW